jgi:uncharacterized protein YcfJ
VHRIKWIAHDQQPINQSQQLSCIVQPLESHTAQQCYQTKNMVQVNNETKRYLTTLAGAVIGGVIGNQFGKGKRGGES